MGKIREGCWDCQSCGKTGIMGHETICPGCGDVRGKDVKFYLPDDAPVVTDTEKLKEANLGPNWNCEHCGSANKADRDNCHQCGAPKGESKSNQVKDYEPSKPPNDEHSATDHSFVSQPSDPESNDNERSNYDDVPKHIRAYRDKRPPTGRGCALSLFPQLPKNKIKLYGGIGLGVILLGLIAFLFLHTKDVPVKLTTMSWTREIQIEKFKTVEEEDWSIPSGGREKSHEQKIHHYVKVFDHNETRHRTVSVQVGTDTEEYSCGQTDKGNGYFEENTCTRSVPRYENRDETYQEAVYRDDPVYQTWYTYDIERWKYERSVHSGGNDQKVYWPEFTLANPPTQIGKERKGRSKENYEAKFRGGPKDKEYKLTFDYQRWSTLEVGATYTGKMNIMGMLLSIEDPK